MNIGTGDSRAANIPSGAKAQVHFVALNVRAEARTIQDAEARTLQQNR